MKRGIQMPYNNLSCYERGPACVFLLSMRGVLNVWWKFMSLFKFKFMLSDGQKGLLFVCDCIHCLRFGLVINAI